MANKHIKGHSISLIIREMQIKTTMGSHLAIVRMAITRKNTNNKLLPGCRGKGVLLQYQWECKLMSHFGKQIEVSQIS